MTKNGNDGIAMEASPSSSVGRYPKGASHAVVAASFELSKINGLSWSWSWPRQARGAGGREEGEVIHACADTSHTSDFQSTHVQ